VKSTSKLAAFAAILTIASIAAKCQAVIPWQSGKLVFHPSVLKNLLADVPESALYYVGDYTCLESTRSNVAPTCKTKYEWTVIEKNSYTEFFAADGTLLYDVESTTPYANVFSMAGTDWSGALAISEGEPKTVCKAGVCEVIKLPLNHYNRTTPTESEIRYRSVVRNDGSKLWEIAVQGHCEDLNTPVADRHGNACGSSRNTKDAEGKSWIEIQGVAVEK